MLALPTAAGPNLLAELANNAVFPRHKW